MKPEILEAQKKLKAEKPKEPRLLIAFGYDKRFVLPYQAGVEVLKHLAAAETLNDRYSSRRYLTPVDKDTLEATPFSGQEYEAIKLAAILNMSVDELMESMKESQ